MLVLQAEDIHKQYRDAGEPVPVLKGVDLSLARGEIVALEGPSGSGKTTFLSILGCLLTATSGRLAIEGDEVDPEPAGAALAVPSRLDRLRLPAVQPVPVPDGGRERRVCPEHQGASRARGRPGGPQVAGGGRAWKPGSGSALGTSPAGRSSGWPSPGPWPAGSPIILADEPTGNLDHQSGEQILDLFRDLARREERALLIVTHDPKVRRIADRVVRVLDGRIIAGEA